MRVLFISKRFPQQRDLLTRPYGRFHYLPKCLAQLGYTVRVQLVSHRRLPSAELFESGVEWSSHDVLSLGPAGLWGRVVAEVRDFAPQWIVGCSDAWYGWLAHCLSRKFNRPFAVDAYDNFEAYMPWNRPLHRLWRNAVRAAKLVTAAGPQLADLLRGFRDQEATVQIIPMAPDPMFAPLDRTDSRRALGLPDSIPLVGYFGSWTRNRGTGILLDGIRQVLERRPDIRLVATGRIPDRIRKRPEVISLGYVDDAELPLAVNSVNVACVITADNRFGRYSYPAKLCEAMACGTPVAATGTDPVRWMLGNDLRFIAPVGSASELGRRILANVDLGKIDYGRQPTWSDSARALDQMLRRDSQVAH